jgi:hypothetical protein
VRHRVAVATTGYVGTLIENGEDLKLVAEGKVFSSRDEVRGTKLEVGIQKPEKAGTHRVVQEWNRAVSCEVITG